MSKEAMKLALEHAKRDERHLNHAETRYWCRMYRDIAEKAVEALAKPDFWEGYVPEPVKPAQQEPDWLNKEQTETDWDHVWLLIKAASYASSKGFVSGTTNWGSAVSRYMRNESPQLAQQEPVFWMYVNKSTHEIKFQKHMRDFVDHGLWAEVPLYGEPFANQELNCVCGAVWQGDELVHLPRKPASKPWVGLTDEQIDRLWSQSLADTESETWLPLREFARAIEAKLKEENT